MHLTSHTSLGACFPRSPSPELHLLSACRAEARRTDVCFWQLLGQGSRSWASQWASLSDASDLSRPGPALRCQQRRGGSEAPSSTQASEDVAQSLPAVTIQSPVPTRSNGALVLTRPSGPARRGRRLLQAAQPGHRQRWQGFCGVHMLVVQEPTDPCRGSPQTLQGLNPRSNSICDPAPPGNVGVGATLSSPSGT